MCVGCKGGAGLVKVVWGARVVRVVCVCGVGGESETICIRFK